MPGRRTRSTVRKTTTTENFVKPPRSVSRNTPSFEDDSYSRDTVARKHDQRIKDDITNTLYRMEMDRIKPGFDVQMKTSNFRTSVYPRRRHFTPEPSLDVVPRQIIDLRRYSTAGNLDIYRPKTQRTEYNYGQPDALSHVDVIKSTTTPIHYWRSPSVTRESVVTSGPLSDYEIRKLAELKVRGRTTNGPLLPYTNEVVTYLPLATHTIRSSTPPASLYRTTTVERDVVPRSAPPGVSDVGRKLHESQHELNQFENLMKTTFGAGGVNRSKTLLYTAPPYTSPYESVRLSPTTSYTYPTLPRSSRTYYAERPYYGSSAAYPYYHSSYPYYASSFYPYTYYSERPAVDYDYGLYSPPTRVTAPGNYAGYYDTGYYGYSHHPTRYYDYDYRPSYSYHPTRYSSSYSYVV